MTARPRRAASRKLAPQPLVLSGNLDSISPEGLAQGWCWSPDEPDTRRAVALLLDGQEVATTICDGFRPDLMAAGIGDGVHAFAVTVPREHRHPGRSCALVLRESASLQQIGAAVTVTWPGEKPEIAAIGAMPVLQGHLDGVSPDGCVSGWAWYPARPDTSASLAILVDGEVAGLVPAGEFREDLRQAGIGAGEHGFAFALPWAMLSGQKTLTITVRDAATGAPFGASMSLCPAASISADSRIAGLERQLGQLRTRIGEMAQALEVRRDAEIPPSASVSDALAALGSRHPPFTLDLPASPRASIAVPAQGGLDRIYRCLRSLHETGIDSCAEIMLVGGPTNDAALLPSIVRNLRYLRMEGDDPAAGFNEVLASARTELVAWLDPALRPEPGWLDVLSDSFTREPDAALIGGRIIDADHLLCHAALVAGADGLPRPIGVLDDAGLPEVSFLRPVDGVGALGFATRRLALLEIGGLRPGFVRPGHAVLDACLRLRAAGHAVLYQPRAIAHCDGEIDLSRTVPALEQDDADSARLRERWFRERGPTLKPVRFVGHALVIDSEIPRPDRDGGSVAVLEQMLLLRRLGYRVTFAAASGDAGGERLEQLGIELARTPHYASVSDYLSRHGGGLDLVQLYRHANAAMFLDRVRALAPNARLIFSPADLHHLREQRRADITGARSQVAQELRERELHCIRAADATILASDAELDLLLPDCADGKLRLLRWIARPDAAPPDFTSRHGIGFVGSFRHGANIDGLCWFVAEVLPLVQARHPGLTLHVAGSDMTDTIRALAAPDVVVHGWVKDLPGWLGRLRLTVAPLRYGAGFKGKIATSLAQGVPVMGTTIAIEGTGLEEGDGIAIADTAEAFAAELVRLHDDAVRWRSIAARGLERCRALYSVEAGLGVYRGILQDLGLPMLGG